MHRQHFKMDKTFFILWLFKRGADAHPGNGFPECAGVNKKNSEPAFCSLAEGVSLSLLPCAQGGSELCGPCSTSIALPGQTRAPY